MTAIGFGLLAIGWFFARMFQDPLDSLRDRVSPIALIFCLIALIGIILMIVGIGKWLWGVMP